MQSEPAQAHGERIRVPVQVSVRELLFSGNHSDAIRPLGSPPPEVRAKRFTFPVTLRSISRGRIRRPLYASFQQTAPGPTLFCAERRHEYQIGSRLSNGKVRLYNQCRQSMAGESPKEDPLVEWLAWLMDESIRIGPWAIGLDPLIGLIPGFGDMAGAVVSALIITRAMQSGIAKSAILRMVINVALDSLAGAVPFFGDVFDFAFKSNVYNLRIYREALRGERKPVRDWFFILFVAVVLLAIIVLPIIGLIYLTRFLISYI